MELRLRKIENSVLKKPTDWPKPSVCIVDVKAEIQSLNVKSMKFSGDIAKFFINQLNYLIGHYTEVHYVFDRYDTKRDLKAQERAQRYNKHICDYDITASRPIPEWNKIVSSDVNKQKLILFLCTYIEKNFKFPLEEQSNEKNIYLAGGYDSRYVTKRITISGSQEVYALFSNHVEADSRIISHVHYVAKQNPNT